jgi:hypothetical protein
MGNTPTALSRLARREVIRRLRIGDLQKFLRFRYGPTLPDDDAGRDDLHEVLLPISLGPQGDWQKLKNAIEVWAPWMDADEAGPLIDRINRTPRHLRLRTARQLGDRLRVTTEERERLKLKTIKPFDVTDKQLKELRKAKHRARMKRKRGRTPRVDYLANALTRQKPWEAEGIGRRQWERRRKQAHVAGMCAVKFTTYRAHTCDIERPAPSEEATDKKTRRRKNWDGLKPSPRLPATRTHLRHHRRDDPKRT